MNDTLYDSMNERYHADTRFAYLTRAVAERSFGIAVPEETFQNWITLARWWGALDDAIDMVQDSEIRQNVRSGLVDYVKGESDVIPSEDEDIRAVIPTVRPILETLTEESKNSFVSHMEVFCDITEKTRQATDIREYSRLRIVEAQLDMQTFHDTASDSMKLHPNFAQYTMAINRMFSATNNLDAAVDLADDFADGTTQIKPTLPNKLYLLKDSFIQAVKGIRAFNFHVINTMRRFK